MTFPISPANGATHQAQGGTLYQWSAAKSAWQIVGGSSASASTAYLLDGSRALLGDMPANQYRINGLGDVYAAATDRVTGVDPAVDGFKLSGGSY